MKNLTNFHKTVETGMDLRLILYTGDQASTSFIMEGKTRSSKSNPSFLYISGNMVACGRASTRRPMFTI